MNDHISKNVLVETLVSHIFSHGTPVMNLTARHCSEQCSSRPCFVLYCLVCMLNFTNHGLTAALCLMHELINWLSERNELGLFLLSSFFNILGDDKDMCLWLTCHYHSMFCQIHTGYPPRCHNFRVCLSSHNVLILLIICLVVSCLDYYVLWCQIKHKTMGDVTVDLHLVCILELDWAFSEANEAMQEYHRPILHWCMHFL